MGMLRCLDPAVRVLVGVGDIVAQSRCRPGPDVCVWVVQAYFA
jgi:hypothetical protein